MKKHLEKIKKRPIEERKKLATIFAVIVTLFVVLLSFLLGSVLKTYKKVEKDKHTNSFEKMFNDIEQKFSEFDDGFPKHKEEGVKKNINMGTENNPVYIDTID